MALFSTQLNNGEKRKVQLTIVAASQAAQTNQRKLKCDQISKKAQRQDHQHGKTKKGFIKA
jgi:hypothetical protein